MARFVKGIIPWNKGKVGLRKKYFCSVCKSTEVLRKTRYCIVCRSSKSSITGGCSICGKTITRYKSEWDLSKDHYCSRVCYARSVSIRQQGSLHHLWKGSGVGYPGIHKHLRKNFGHLKLSCEECGKRERLHFALKSGHSYTRDIEDYRILCISCHWKYDEHLRTSTKREVVYSI